VPLAAMLGGASDATLSWVNGTRRRGLSAVLAVTAALGAIAGAAIALAFGDSSGSSASASPRRTVLAAAAAPPRPLTAETIYRRAARGVVVITDTQTARVPGTPFAPPKRQKVRVLGSGFVIDRAGDIVTNEHVVENGSKVTVGFSAGATFAAKVLATDPSTDLAVLRVLAPQSALHPLALADSNRVDVGDTVYAIGNPFGLDRTMTSGIVSAVGRDIPAPNGATIERAIQTDAAINHGNSGGPLLDRSGAVIGINDRIDSGGTVDGNVGVGFAVSSNTIRSVVPRLIENGHVAHPWLGVEVAPVDPNVARVVRSLPPHGVVVVEVLKRGPAAHAGLKPATRQVTVDGEGALLGGDVIVSAERKEIRSPAELSDVVGSLRPGAVIALRVSRDRRERTVAVKLGTAP
jgi:S1-C subfamily serine protease